MGSSTPYSEDEKVTINWCVPLLNDAISFEYLQLLGSKTQTHSLLTTTHVRFFTKLLEGDDKTIMITRRQLIDFAKKEKIEIDTLSKIDRAVIQHLTSTILRRDKTRNHKREKEMSILIDAAIKIGELNQSLVKPKENTSNIHQMLNKL